MGLFKKKRVETPEEKVKRKEAKAIKRAEQERVLDAEMDHWFPSPEKKINVSQKQQDVVNETQPLLVDKRYKKF